ncbi:hypothetical protein GGX14DRAFT_462387 [Mycena pura]|uniref:Uncharacterized protein n=1 Tax=Mycena pura TaxID=153505 RepID=A0AAD6V8J9_9AGAR|nr:hypothetical protein GGX14DRAFT_462387 [Mycena pura]
MTDLFNSRVEQVLPPISTRPASLELLNSFGSCLRIKRIYNKASVRDYMKGLLQVAADMAQDIEQISMRLSLERSTTTAIQPRVVQEIIGIKWVGPEKEDFRTVVSSENKSPSVGQYHFNRLQTVAKNAGERGWTIPALRESHSYVLLCDGTCIYVLVKRNLNSPSFYLSPPLSLVDPNLFRILAVPFMMDPPSSIIGSDSPESPSPTNTAAPPPTASSAHAAISMADPSSPFAPIPINQCLGDRPDKVVLLKPSHPILDDIGPIVLSSFDPAPSRATIFRGHAGTQPIVLKMAEEGRDDETREEGKVYRERLRGLEGVPKLYAEGRIKENINLGLVKMV